MSMLNLSEKFYSKANHLIKSNFANGNYIKKKVNNIFLDTSKRKRERKRKETKEIVAIFVIV